MDDANDVSINSNGEIVESRTAAVATTSKPWTIQKRDTSNKYIEKIEYRRTTFTKKWKTLKTQAEALASQTGAEIKIVIYNPDNKKTVTFHTSNITKMKGPGAATKMTPPLVLPPPVTDSPSKSLTLQPPVDFYSNATAAPLLPTSNLTTLPGGGQLSNLVTQKQNLLKTKKRCSTKRKISDKICPECGVTYDTPRDKELKNSEEYQWISCDGDKCKCWGHAKCLSVTVENIKNDFLCPEHKH